MAVSGGDKPRHYDHHPSDFRRGGVYPLPKHRRDDSSQTGSQSLSEAMMTLGSSTMRLV
jgi:hypothetical protein